MRLDASYPRTDPSTMLPSFSASLFVGRGDGDGALISDALQQLLSSCLRGERVSSYAQGIKQRKSGNALQEGPSQLTKHFFLLLFHSDFPLLYK